MNRFDLLWAAVQEEIPGARIINKKNSAFMQTIFTVLKWLVRIFTLGKGKADWSGYTTTIVRTMYVPAGFFHWADEDKYRLLRHELVHLRQFRSWPIKAFARPHLWPINAFIMGLCYLLVLPVFFTFRAKFEREGYTQSLLSWFEIRGFDDLYINRKIDQMVETFGGSPYMFMSTRKKARIWVLATISSIQSGDITNDQDNVDVWPLAA